MREEMKALICTRCGASDFVEIGGMLMCKYCKTKYQKQVVSTIKKRKATTSIALNDDIAALLKKCKDDPLNARRYANRILDIDPTNIEARRFL